MKESHKNEIRKAALDFLADKHRLVAIDPGSYTAKFYPGGVPESGVECRNVFGQVNQHQFGNEPPDFRFCQPWEFSSDQYALRYGGEPTTKQDPAWLLSPEFSQVMYTLLAKAKIQDGATLVPTFAVPIEDKKRYADELKAQWTGKHTYCLVGQEPVTVTFEAPMVTQQGIAAAIYYALDGNGKIVYDILEKDVFVVDCGERDVNFCLLRGMIDDENLTGTLRGMGFWNVVYDVSKWLKREHDISLNPVQLSEYINHPKTLYIDGKGNLHENQYNETWDPVEGCFLFWKDQWIDLTKQVKKYTEQYGRQQVDAISKLKLPETVTTCLICGGNAERFLPYYQEFRSIFQPLPWPRYASVIGAYLLRKYLIEE